ncbi:hypothetical protein SAMN05428944_1036 [Streptomyces sp. 1222.5]|nr:hypothetical protein BX260_7059 [Streptomyces sp. 5112.2]SEB71171.1 hypothetical protein SAMN05428944_1036 [Streptomyces sp. 1222.5]SEE19532.1 hypothetical protein SAMN05216532_7287 [Streptomyces sp. 2231.1]
MHHIPPHRFTLRRPPLPRGPAHRCHCGPVPSADPSWTAGRPRPGTPPADRLNPPGPSARADGVRNSAGDTTSGLDSR